MPPTYLQPYLNAAAKHGAGFGSLLWASPRTQAIRFNALVAAVDLDGKRVLDVGCGRADLLEFLMNRNFFPTEYVGLEALEPLAEAARAKQMPGCRIRQADFVLHPTELEVGADVVLFSGSLNTLNESAFYRSIMTAFGAAREALVFNFLCSSKLAASSYLTWHGPKKVLAFCNKLSDRVQMWDGYLEGDATICINKRLETRQ